MCKGPRLPETPSHSRFKPLRLPEKAVPEKPVGHLQAANRRSEDDRREGERDEFDAPMQHSGQSLGTTGEVSYPPVGGRMTLHPFEGVPAGQGPSGGAKGR